MASANTGRNTRGLVPWRPGQSGNPSGRPKGSRDLAQYVLQSTNEGEDLVKALIAIAEGQMPSLPRVKGSKPRKAHVVRVSDRLQAIKILLDYGWGKPGRIDEIGDTWQHNVRPHNPFEDLSTEELRAFLKIVEQTPETLPGADVIEGEVVEVDDGDGRDIGGEDG